MGVYVGRVTRMYMHVCMHVRGPELLVYVYHQVCICVPPGLCMCIHALHPLTSVHSCSQLSHIPRISCLSASWFRMTKSTRYVLMSIGRGRGEVGQEGGV